MVTIEEFKKKQSETSRLIGLDLGSKRIGVSICDEKQSIATPFKTINKTNNDDLINELKTDNVEPLTSVAETTLKLRSDEVKSKNLRDQVIKNSPKENEDYFVVPKVIE